MKIIVYVLDSLRFDHVSCYGYHRETTPNIDRLAADGIVFDRSFTPSTWTRPVAASLLSGTYPGVHGVQERKDIFTASVPRLPVLLKEAGFNTACVSAIGNVSTAMGFAEGFDYFCDLYKEPNLLETRMKTSGAVEGLDDKDEIVFPLAEDINAYFIPWLKENISEDVFALLWSIQPHAPYEPPKGFQKFVSPDYDDRFAGKRDMVRRARTEQDTRYLIDLYDSEIYYNDHMIGEIIKELEAQGVYDETLFIIVGDHGEAFGEHDLFSHGHLPYDIVMQVPMVVKLPNNAYQGTKVSQLVSLLDIPPTLLAYTGIEYPDDVSPILMGANLLPVLEDPSLEAHDYVYCETRHSDTKPVYYGVTNSEWKYMRIDPPKLGSRNIKDLWSRLIHERIVFSILRNPMWLLKRYRRLKGEMLFSKPDDPGENKNVISEEQDVLAEMQLHLADWLEKCENFAETFVSGYKKQEDDETMRKHRSALGYLD